MLSLFELLAALLTLTALFGWINHRFLRLPANIGMLVMALAASLMLIATEFAFPRTPLYGLLAGAVGQIDFYEAVMHGMLGFLLFAGALHVDLEDLRNRAVTIAILASLGVVISMVVVAVGLWAIAGWLGMPIPFAWCLVFGALIAPTDPVAVLSTLRQVRVPPALRTDMTGESLFNDGVGVVLFTLAVSAAVQGPGEVGVPGMVRLLLFEAGGGALLGLVTGYAAYLAIRSIDDYAIETMISIALVTGTYAVAERLHMSAPISVVVAGVLMGNRGADRGMSDQTRRYVFGFWTLVDEILNAVLFLLIGLEVLVLAFAPSLAWIGLAAIPLVLVARFLAVAGPVAILSRRQSFAPGTVAILTWGGIRGGISIALALSLPEGPARAPILHATYAVVLFSVIIQGLSLAWLARRVAVTR
ncbi:sodium:proton antiporter [Allostella vacuolata]|nr:sodium:proton antiporter [Stella vacuolata]